MFPLAMEEETEWLWEKGYKVQKHHNRMYNDLSKLMHSMFKKSRKFRKKGLVDKPMVFGEMNSREQVDLIDMQSQADEENKWIFVYQDHLTKFVQL